MQARKQYADQIAFLDVESEKFKGQMNVKGAIQRNKKIVKALTSVESDKYIFTENKKDETSLPLTF